MQLRSITRDSYDRFAEIFSSRNLQYPTMLLRFLISKKSIGSMTPGCNIDSEWDAVLTQSSIVWTRRVRGPPFWLRLVTALDRNC